MDHLLIKCTDTHTTLHTIKGHGNFLILNAQILDVVSKTNNSFFFMINKAGGKKTELSGPTA